MYGRMSGRGRVAVAETKIHGDAIFGSRFDQSERRMRRTPRMRTTTRRRLHVDVAEGTTCAEIHPLD